MAGVARFTVSVEPELLERLDRWVDEKGFANRSHGVRDLMRARLNEEAWGDDDVEAFATVTYVYDHHKRDLLETLAHIFHSHLAGVVSTMHVHLDHQHCLEVSVLKGPAAEVRRLAERIVSLKGILGGSISLPIRKGLLQERTYHHEGHVDKPHEH